MKDPTAKAAARNVTAAQRAAFIVFMEDGVKQRVWMDLPTWRHLQSLIVKFDDDTGERHIRFPEVTR